MKILLIGKNGQLGIALEKVCNKTIELHSFSKETFDITNKQQARLLIKRIKPTVVINTAAYHVVSRCEENPLDAFLINCIAVKNLSELCMIENSIFVTYSTDYVFDGTKGLPYREADKPNPLQVYGLSKLAGEYAALNENIQKTFIIRTNGLFGGKNGSKSKGGNFVISLLRELRLHESIEVGDNYFANPTSANELAKATLALLQRHANPGIYHLASEGYCSWFAFAQKIVKYAKLKKTIIPIQRKEGFGVLKRPLFSVLANNKAKKLGIILPTVDESVEKYIHELGHFGK